MTAVFSLYSVAEIQVRQSLQNSKVPIPSLIEYRISFTSLGI